MGLRTKLYKFYRYKIYKVFPEKRGMTRLHDFLKSIALLEVENYSGEPETINEKQWHNLIILDACRHDIYEEVNGKTPKRVTVGSHSREFIEKTFSDGDFSDTIYISANPHFSEDEFKKFTGRDVEEVFFDVYHTYSTDWDDQNRTVMPEDVARDAKTAQKLFPEKKKVIHFMQPHHPFIEFNYSEYEEDGSIWDIAQKGLLSRDKIWNAYRENLEYVMPHVRELAQELEGRTVVTADHGNLAGENGLYHHPYGAKSKGLREVPWDVISEE
ncbi:hypothetical protein [Candidatus Nanohalococcus occultus]|uniref:hypothetical protein n=1 Tax=Candidatus Nanohalococcus occultus TaxID=2978047 RepID=UPI0039E1F16A